MEGYAFYDEEFQYYSKQPKQSICITKHAGQEWQSPDEMDGNIGQWQSEWSANGYDNPKVIIVVSISCLISVSVTVDASMKGLSQQHQQSSSFSVAILEAIVSASTLDPFKLIKCKSIITHS